MRSAIFFFALVALFQLVISAPLSNLLARKETGKKTDGSAIDAKCLYDDFTMGSPALFASTAFSYGMDIPARCPGHPQWTTWFAPYISNNYGFTTTLPCPGINTPFGFDNGCTYLSCNSYPGGIGAMIGGMNTCMNSIYMMSKNDLKADTKAV